MALTVILIVLSGVIESSSLFILALASFATGIVERKFSLRTGIAFTIGAALIGFFVAPQKLYVFTYLGFSIYVVVAEYFRDKKIYGIKPFVIKGVLYHVLLAAAVALVNCFVGFDMFLENSLNVSETARQLYVHRNTLLYRLEKLQKVTGLDIRVFDDALTLKIALMVVNYMKYLNNLEY